MSKDNYQHVASMLELMSNPEVAGNWDRYTIASIAEQALRWLNSPVHCLTRPGEDGILGVYRLRELAKARAEQCFDPNEMRIEAFLVEDEVDDE